MAFVPIFSAPGLDSVKIPTLKDDTIYKWIDWLGGGILDGPLPSGTLNPNGVPASAGIATTNSAGIVTIEYHYAGGNMPTFSIECPYNENNVFS